MILKAKNRSPNTRGASVKKVVDYSPELALAKLAHRRYCMSCGSKLVLEASKRVGLCRACCHYCTSCGGQTNEFGYYEVCFRCKPEVDATAKKIRLNQGRLPAAPKDVPPPERADCIECGDPAEKVLNGKPLCADCYAELTVGEIT